jgi:hypothetical protein
MKTNQMMQIDFNGSILEVEHKTKFGSLTELWRIGNDIRRSKGRTELGMENYLRSPETLELVQALERKYGIYKGNVNGVESTDLKINKDGTVETIKSPLIKTKRGRYGGGTWAHLYLLLDAAMRLDADFKVQLFDILVEGKLCEWRDDSGDSYKALNVAIDMMLAQNNKPALIVNYIRVADALKDKISPTGGDWNSAHFSELKRRTDIENNLIVMMKLGFLKSVNEIVLAVQNM